MNKKILFAGAVAVAGFVTLTAFGGETLEQQKAKIDQAVKEKLESFRTEKQQECTEKVNAEAQRRFDEAMAAKAAEEAAKPTGKKATTKKGASGPKAPALPPAKPADPAQAKKDKTAGTAPAPNTEAKSAKTAGEAPASNTNAKKAKTAGTGGN